MKAKAKLPEPRPTKAAIYLTALVLPGAGQLLQGRWTAAILYGGSFLFFFGILLFQVGRILFQNVRAAMAFAESAPNMDFSQLSARAVWGPLAIAFLIYVISICDTYLAYMRECTRWAEKRLEERLQLGLPPPLLTLLLVALFVVSFPPAPTRASDLQVAILSNDLARVASILETSNPHIVRETISDGATPLHLASALGSRFIIQMLVARGADIGARTTGGFTPLHWAASRDSADAARLLIRLGSDVNATAERGLTPLHWAAGKNATNTVKVLIQAGANLQAKTDTGFTPLQWATLNRAGESAIILAYMIVSDQMDREATNTVAAGESLPAEDDTADLPPVTAGSRPSFGASLIVPLGRGEQLTFIWLRDLKVWAGKYEITNGQLRRFLPRHDSRFREDYSLNANDQPAVYVSWNDARSFVAWLNKRFGDRIPEGCEFRLPSEIEWIKMARSGDSRKYPWGNRWPPAYGNFSDLSARKAFSNWSGISTYDDGFAVTCPVEQSGANEWGIFGLAGNAWEWCEDSFDSSGTYKVRHGGSWDYDERPSLEIGFRGFDRPDVRDDTIGFRLVVSPKP